MAEQKKPGPLAIWLNPGGVVVLLAAAVTAALETPHIVQERVEIPGEPYPSWVDGTVELIDRQYDTAPFITNGEYMEGLLTRLSTAVLLNVTAGGGSTVPTFLVSKRS